MNFTNISNFNQLHESDDLSSTLRLYISDFETVGLVFFCRIVWICWIYAESRLNSVNYSD